MIPPRPGVGTGTGGGGTPAIAEAVVTSFPGVKGDVDPSMSNLATAAAACADSSWDAATLPLRDACRRCKKFAILPPGRTAPSGCWLFGSLINSGLGRGDGVTARPRLGLLPLLLLPPLAAGGGGDSCKLAGRRTPRAHSSTAKAKFSWDAGFKAT